MQSMRLALGAVALGAAMLLQGCTVGTEKEHCNGDTCSCSLTFHSFWARIKISGVHIEHSSRIFSIPDVAKDVPNATSSPCCSAIFDQIDYDEGKPASMANKSVDTFKNACGASPNKDIVSAATGKKDSEVVSHVVVRKLHGLRKANATSNISPKSKLAKAQEASQLPPGGYQPIHDGQDGRDCDVSTTDGFPLNGALISKGSMELKVRWVDPTNGGTSCCDALTPILQKVYLDGVPESQLDPALQKDFCSKCTGSPNQGIALAAWRCFNPASHVENVAV
jgi:hypothetical protein